MHCVTSQRHTLDGCPCILVRRTKRANRVSASSGHRSNLLLTREQCLEAERGAQDLARSPLATHLPRRSSQRCYPEALEVKLGLELALPCHCLPCMSRQRHDILDAPLGATTRVGTSATPLAHVHLLDSAHCHARPHEIFPCAVLQALPRGREQATLKHHAF